MDVSNIGTTIREIAIEDPNSFIIFQELTKIYLIYYLIK